jgi:DNA polymerase-3 subunit delta
MSEERLKALARDIKEGRLEPAYLFEGDDEYRKLRALEALKKIVVGESPADMAFERLENVAAAELCERARTAPFFVERRLLVGTGVEKYGDADLAALTAYAADPSSSAVVVFWVEGKLDRRKKLFKFFDKLGAVYTFEHLTGNARRARIAAEAKRLGVKLSDEAAAYLDYALAPDLFTVVRELEKLAAYAGGEELSADVVVDVVAASRVEKAYDMVRFIWLAKELYDAGLGPSEIAARLKVPPLYVSEYVDAARRLDAERLAELHHLLAELDRGVKTGRVPAALALELFAARAAT